MIVVLAVVVGSLSMCVGVWLGAALSATRLADLHAEVGSLMLLLEQADFDTDPADDEAVEQFASQLDEWDGNPDNL